MELSITVPVPELPNVIPAHPWQRLIENIFFFRDPSLAITIITITTSCKKLLKFTEVYLFFFSNSVEKAGGLTTLTTLTSTIHPSSKSKL